MNLRLFKSFFFLSLFSFHGFSQEATTIRIDPLKAYGGTFDQYFDSIEYIPLETNKESLFGSIVQLLITQNTFVISDFDTHSVLFFNKNGKFVTKIKKNNNIYPNISYDSKSKMIVVSIYNEIKSRTENEYYSDEGKLLASGDSKIYSKSNVKLVSLGEDFYAGTNSCYYSVGAYPKDSTISLLNIFHKDTVYKSFFSYNQKGNAGVCAFGSAILDLQSSHKSGTLYLSTPLDYNIYKVTKDTAEKLFKLIFPVDRTFPLKVVETNDITLIDSIRKTKWRNDKIIINISNIFLKDSLLFFKINTPVSSFSQRIDEMKPYNFVYNTSNGKLVALERITADSTNFYLPFYNWGISLNGLKYDSDFMYTYVSSLELFSAYEKEKARKIAYPASLQNYFAKQTRKSNPVIVKFKIRLH